MQIALSSCAFLSLFFSAHAEVVEKFQDVPECLKYFYKEKVPEWGASTPGAARLCQCFVNRYHFATLYDTIHHIAVYSAYQFQPSNGGGRERRWFVEPQLVNKDWSAEMKRSDVLDYEHPGVYQGEKQALDEDYKGSGYDRGHLNPNGHHDDAESRAATFTLTNVVPQVPSLNGKVWNKYDRKLTNLFKEKCSKVYLLAGAIPSDKCITKTNEKGENENRVNIPNYVWHAYCCLDNNDNLVLSGGATAQNQKGSQVEKLTLDQVGKFLQKFSNQPVGGLFDSNCEPQTDNKKM